MKVHCRRCRSRINPEVILNEDNHVRCPVCGYTDHYLNFKILPRNLIRKTSMPFKHKIIRFGLLRRIRSGVVLALIPSYKCNLNCSYCGLQLNEDKSNYKMPLENEIKSLEWWKNYIDTFPIKINKVTISGGEPGLISYISEFVNYLVSKKYIVEIYSNFSTIANFKKIKPSVRFKFGVTYHARELSEKQKQTFKKNYDQMYRKYRVDVNEIDSIELGFSVKKKFIVINQLQLTHKNNLRVNPDGSIYTNCYASANANSVKQDKNELEKL